MKISLTCLPEVWQEEDGRLAWLVWAHIEVSEALACTVMRIYEVNASTAYHLQGGTKLKK